MRAAGVAIVASLRRDMSRPIRLAQITDCHVGATWVPDDPIAGVTAANDAIAGLEDPVDALLISGDLAENRLDSEYERLAAVVAALGVPVYALPGNHDDRDRLRRQFGPPGPAGTAVQYAVDLGGLRLVALDTTRPGSDGGELDAPRLAWLDHELAAVGDIPTVVAMHHPPFLTGMRAFDRIGLPDADRTALAQVIGRHAQVRALVAGHIHRASTATVAGRPAITIPSTYVQAELRFQSDALAFAAATPGFAIHTLAGDELVTHTEFVALD